MNTGLERWRISFERQLFLKWYESGCIIFDILSAETFRLDTFSFEILYAISPASFIITPDLILQTEKNTEEGLFIDLCIGDAHLEQALSSRLDLLNELNLIEDRRFNT